MNFSKNDVLDYKIVVGRDSLDTESIMHTGWFSQYSVRIRL